MMDQSQLAEGYHRTGEWKGRKGKEQGGSNEKENEIYLWSTMFQVFCWTVYMLLHRTLKTTYKEHNNILKITLLAFHTNQN